MRGEMRPSCVRFELLYVKLIDYPFQFVLMFYLLLYYILFLICL